MEETAASCSSDCKFFQSPHASQDSKTLPDARCPVRSYLQAVRVPSILLMGTYAKASIRYVRYVSLNECVLLRIFCRAKVRGYGIGPRPSIDVLAQYPAHGIRFATSRRHLDAVVTPWLSGSSGMHLNGAETVQFC